MTDRFLRACRRQAVDRTPVWLMRQAGRYLPEYRALRQRVDFLTLCKTPELAVEASLQPLRRFPLDAAIIFSDILLPLEALGCRMTFNPGPRLAEPIRTREQVAALDRRAAAETVPFVGEAVGLLRRELDGRTPVIGFCGAPFTLAAYLVQGEGKEGFGALKTLQYREPATLEALLETLTAAMIDYLRLQISSGAQAVQIFDSWAGLLDSPGYQRFALRWVRTIVDGIADLEVPVIYFINGGPHLIEDAATSGADVLGICWRTPLDVAAARVGPGMSLQGNLDPHALFAAPDEVRRLTRDVLARAAGLPGHIMNLGHGILPDTPIPSVEALIDTVQHTTGKAAQPATETCRR
ncbi:MAG: uroporphyrinogen decarboxylase [Acidobacteria bacterium]|nr:uroporphyrinogen decarboxylase [Acidobacteriota bacterium]